MNEVTESQLSITADGLSMHANRKSKKIASSHLCEIQLLRTRDEVSAIRPIWESLQASSDRPKNIETDFERYISILDSDPKHEPYIQLLFIKGVPRAMFIGTYSTITIPCNVGYLKVLKPSIQGVKIMYEGYLGDSSEQTCSQMLDYLYRSLRGGQVDVIRFEQLARQSQLYTLVRKHTSIFCRSHFLKYDKHWRMNIPCQMELFYDQHSSKTRQTLKRYIRKLERHYQVHVFECSSAEGLQGVMTMAADISRQTYQHALGWGFVYDDSTRHQLEIAVRHGWLRFHVLSLGETPCAFQYGFQYQGTYYLQAMGFDPALRKWHIGTVLFLKIIEKLCEDPNVECFDFGYGDAEYKRRFGTKHWDEATMYVFAPRFYPVLVNSFHAVVGGLSAGMRCAVQKSGLENKIKQYWRRILQKGNSVKGGSF